jgi:hypothetical protein
MGRTEADRKITSEPWSSMQSGRKKTTKTTLRSGRSSALKKDLTEPTLLEMSGYTQSDLDKVALRLNQRPRKTLGFQTPASRLRDSVASTH